MATVSPSWNYTLHLPRDPKAPGVARATLRSVLAAHGLAQLLPTAELLASELLSNAHLHTGGPYSLGIRHREPGRLVVAVRDVDPYVPVAFQQGAPAAAPPEGAEHGRGLHLVTVCADSWGVSVAREGKVLWVECKSTGE
ncbi:hypothetical protein GCM10010145_69310 [Streptomyces ruber]|uniref:Histidine kinase/HSP90-like ATPase domain-containing protein n=2 Tax=Streptomyces TaxID=1883 RepID=A0A918BSC8_9ACTN|nr:ATP-binding protein [Streptomyces ruber]GGQ90023.1 hypothetical protein GCM10010145_69310 [Streptomyces ruber]